MENFFWIETTDKFDAMMLDAIANEKPINIEVEKLALKIVERMKNRKLDDKILAAESIRVKIAIEDR